MKIGIQMYSVRDVTNTDMRGALQKLAAMGYTSVEFAGFFDIPAADIAAWLKEYGLTVSGTHTRIDEPRDNFEATVAYHKAIGNTNIIIPAADLKSQEKLDLFVAQVNELQPRLKSEGIRLAYHNHDHEFKPNEDGSMIYEQLLERTTLDLEIDTFWAYAGGQNPIEMMETLKDRLIYIHIKDGYQDRRGMPLGQGTAPVADVYRKAVAMGVPMVVESETLTPDGLTEAKICIDYLKSLA
ncbi:sugar phosphate isomerase/epimerase [Ruminococcaceae bacterium OttesenSCG-928-L11]|nr:sugar phosphate isomerase/epimerase [Ruminococcaceae bacterium OttesenSCG-928-L11]